MHRPVFLITVDKAVFQKKKKKYWYFSPFISKKHVVCTDWKHLGEWLQMNTMIKYFDMFLLKNKKNIYRDYYMAIFISYPISARDTRISLIC